MKMVFRCEAIMQGERCILEQGHQSSHKKHWITQEELNVRLKACGYGCSMYPANWWSENNLLKVERMMFHIKSIEELKGKKLDDGVVLGILRDFV